MNLKKAGGFYNATLGNKDSQSVTINSNSDPKKKITFDSEHRNAINCYGKLTIKNAIIDSNYNTAGSTWDDYGLIFRYQEKGKNEVVFNNVVFNRQVVIEKGVKATFNNCTINQTSATGDMYALWICAGADVTLNKCTIESKNPNSGKYNRAIKIADEYIWNGENGSVTAEDVPATKLSVSDTTFKSDKKAAVLVTSVGGADITWGNNNDISGVEKDKVNPVWIDEARSTYSSKVSATGCTPIIEQ